MHPRATPPGPPSSDVPTDLELRIYRTGEGLLASLSALLEDVPEARQGPQALARGLGMDKVLTSRVLKALRSVDPMFVVHRIPGPDPLRRLLDALEGHGADPARLAAARGAVERFERLIRDELGDRSSLDAITSAWVPEARREFELRRKQAAYRALSQLHGVETRTLLTTALLHPSADGEHIDVAWVCGLLGVHRLRPGAPIRFTSRRVFPAHADGPSPTGEAVLPEEFEGGLLEEFCSTPIPRLGVERYGRTVHYTLSNDGLGPGREVDLVHAQVFVDELQRALPDRKRFVFAEVSTPAKSLQFDTFIHEDLHPGSSPALSIHDTAFEGIVDVNDPARDTRLLDLHESIEPLGAGLGRCRSPEIPRYTDLIRTVCARMGWDGSRFLGFRCNVAYPIYGSQVTMTFPAPFRQAERAADPGPASERLPVLS